MENKDLLQERIKLLRKEKGITQTKLAADLGVEKSTISKYEKGGSPSYQMLWNLADYFNVSVDYLIGKSNSFSGDPEQNKEIEEMKTLFKAMSYEQQQKALKVLRIFRE